MSVAALKAVLGASIQPASAKLMAVVVAWHYNDERGSAWPSVPTMASECGMTTRHAQRVLADLKEMGVLVVVSAGEGGNKYTGTTHYAFDLTRLGSLTADRPNQTGDAQVAGDTGVGGDAREVSRDNRRRPMTPVPRNPRHPGRKPMTPVSPKRDERKPTASLSSKEPAAPDSAEGRSADTGNTNASGKVVHMASAKQQPALDDERRLQDLAWLAKAEPVVFLNDDAALSAIGVRLGMESLAGFVGQGKQKIEYIRPIMELWAEVRKMLKAARKRQTNEAGKAAGSARP